MPEPKIRTFKGFFILDIVDEEFEQRKRQQKRRNDNYELRNPGDRLRRVKEWRKKNRDRHNTYQRARLRTVKRATPPWVDMKAIVKIYENCPPGYQVDHIMPIKGRDRCGLHVPWNLQYLTPLENNRKGNRV